MSHHRRDSCSNEVRSSAHEKDMSCSGSLVGLPAIERGGRRAGKHEPSRRPARATGVERRVPLTAGPRNVHSETDASDAGVDVCGLTFCFKASPQPFRGGGCAIFAETVVASAGQSQDGRRRTGPSEGLVVGSIEGSR